jgi:hypothetical protein
MGVEDQPELEGPPITYVLCMRKPPYKARVLQETLIRQLKQFGWPAVPLMPGFPPGYVHTLTLGRDAKAWDAIESWKQNAAGAAYLVIVWTKAGKRCLSVYDLMRRGWTGLYNIVPTTAEKDGGKLARQVNLWLKNAANAAVSGTSSAP